MIIKVIRKNIGTIVAAFGFVLLCIITFGDLGEIGTDVYWQNVRNNLTSIGFVSISLTLIQTVIKQGIGEQALQRGLNTENTTKIYEEHKTLIKSCAERLLYLPYFLQIYNERNTLNKKREFLVNNGYISEQALLCSKHPLLIHKYKCIRVSLNTSCIKWATVDIVYDKKGRIVTLREYRIKNIVYGIIISLSLMIGTSFLTYGLFFTLNDVPIWQKFVKLITYIIVIALSSILDIIKNYEKGAFSVPNELEEINEIWREFKEWVIPDWVIKEVEEINSTPMEVRHEKREEATNVRTNLQTKQKESENLKNIVANSNVDVTKSCSVILLPDDRELNR